MPDIAGAARSVRSALLVRDDDACLVEADEAAVGDSAYKRALDVTRDKALVRSAQRSWLNYQQATCKFHDVYAQREGMGIARALAARCRVLTTLQRLRELYPILGCAWDEGNNRVKC
jgi:uncharacterized protein YecT (DUF1311 family)